MLPPLKYTLCFLLYQDAVLMIHRKKKPWKDHLNGLGGKLEEGETKEESVIRELKEETGIVVSEDQLIYGGLLTWKLPDEELGLYLFTAKVSEKDYFKGSKETDEGTLEWKKLSEVCDIKNESVAHNIPYFLPTIIMSQTPLRYHCAFDGEVLTSVTLSPLES
jgi:8-oxo-dGTP diphosphatase